MGKKIIFPVIVVATIFLTASGNDMNSCMIRNLEDTVIFEEESPYSNRTGLTRDAKETINYFKDSRKVLIAKLMSLFQIDSIQAVLEWGGGLEKRYYVLIFSEDTIYWLTWVKNRESFGKVVIDNDGLCQSIKQRIEILSRYDGGKGLMEVDEREVLFMTFYYNGTPYKTYYTDYPEHAYIAGNYYGEELNALIHSVLKFIGQII